MAFALGNSERLIRNVEVWISKASTSAGDDCNRCLAQVTLADGALVMVENTEPDLYVAVHRAADRAGWKVARCLGRNKRRAIHRTPVVLPAGNPPSTGDHMQQAG
jgi:ribosome-associated translation inhibitor RaiA